MRKQEIVEAVATAAGLTEREADAALDALLEQITNALSRGESVALLGFGSFSTQHVAARAGRNPQTGQPLQIAASNRVGFKPGKALRELVNR